ncbi:MAG: glycosyltransferase family 2 protein [Bacteroidota bacterium]
MMDISINQAKISIVIVVRNAVKTIENTLKSIINQDYKNFELIILDGLSTDGTLAVIEKYKNEITYFKSEKDNGIYDAMNKSIEHCTGDYIYFIGADDELNNKTVLANIFKNQLINDDIIYGNAFYIKRKKIRFGKINRYHLCKHNFNHQTIFYPKSVFKNYCYETKYTIWADYYLNINLFFIAKYKFAYVKVIVSKFNDLGTSGINNIDMTFEKDRKKIVSEIFPFDVYVFHLARRLFLTLQRYFKN